MGLAELSVVDDIEAHRGLLRDHITHRFTQTRLPGGGVGEGARKDLTDMRQQGIGANQTADVGRENAMRAHGWMSPFGLSGIMPHKSILIQPSL